MPASDDFLSRWTIWLAFLVAASVVFSLSLACATPLAAFAAIAAATLRRRDAFRLVIAVWFANQLVGYGALGYPENANSFAWGVIIGLGAILALLGARWAVGRSWGILGAFAAAFIIDQLVLFVATWFLGGAEESTWPVVGEVLIINAAALLGLIALQRLGSALGFTAPRLPAVAAISR